MTDAPLVVNILHRYGAALSAPHLRDIVLRPETTFALAKLRNLAARIRRDATTLRWRRRITRHV